MVITGWGFAMPESGKLRLRASMEATVGYFLLLLFCFKKKKKVHFALC